MNVFMLKDRKGWSTEFHPDFTNNPDIKLCQPCFILNKSVALFMRKVECLQAWKNFSCESIRPIFFLRSPVWSMRSLCKHYHFSWNRIYGRRRPGSPGFLSRSVDASGNYGIVTQIILYLKMAKFTNYSTLSVAFSSVSQWSCMMSCFSFYREV